MTRPAASRPATRALQQALAAEQAATYGYGVLGAHLTGASLAAATAGWNAHQEAAGTLTTLLTARGVVPGAAAVAYQLPGPAGTPGQARALAMVIEERVAAAYLALVAVPERALRQFAAGELRAAALRAAAWRGATVPFPGLTSAGRP